MHRGRNDAARPLDFSTNKRIGRFELIREIARGGMGQVFLGRDTKLGRKVAIKFLLHDDARFVQHFIVEARATARCTHENIVTIFEVGEHDGLPYLVLEYLDGKTVSQLLEAGLSRRQFVELMVPVVRALERAHADGIVHRDLKPSNIFVTDRGQVKVLDFGIARLVDGDEETVVRATMEMNAVEDRTERSLQFDGSDSLIGTLPYMSPEQLGAGEIDHQSDLWAVGIMFWRVFTGVHPAGTMMPFELQERVRSLEPFPSIGVRDPSIPSELVAIIDRCLAKTKADRYPNASALLADLQAFLTPRADRVSGEISPYRGLSAFGEQDAAYFFGRSNEIRTAVSQLEAWPLLAVIGPSGVGKSSFIHAGLIPAMRATDNYEVHVMRPGRVPMHRLTTIIEEALGNSAPRSDLLQPLLDAPGLFGVMLRQAATTFGTRIVVVVDQLEELFTLCDSPELRTMFLTALFSAADDPGAPVRVVVSMRTDFLDRLATNRRFLSELSRGLFFLAAPDHENLRETIVRPAELAGYMFEDPRIVTDMMQVATARGALPLLSFAASRLWEARDRQRRVLTASAYGQMGGVAGAFGRHADQVASAVPPQRQPLLRAIMMRLVTPDRTRAVVDKRDLLMLSRDPDEVAHILDQLVRARLIHMEAAPDQVVTVELVHEILITEWPTLRRWLDDGQASRAFMHELGQAAKQWHGRGKPRDLVWRGATARDALVQAKQQLGLGNVETEFLAAIEQEAARSRRRRLLVFATIAAALALVIAGGSVAVVRIKLAEAEAQEKAKVAVEAQDRLQGQIDALEAEKRKREQAEQERTLAEQQRSAAEQDSELTREQLQELAKQLRQRAEESEAAKKLADAERQRAVDASTQAKTAKQEVEAMLKKEQQRVKSLEESLRAQGISTDSLLDSKRRKGK
jgi:eukaryotic-like serine/threonine-protein kinase